jgi:hypothetical protein
VSGTSAGASFSDTVTGNRLWMSRVREYRGLMRLYRITGEPLQREAVVSEGKDVLWREKACPLRCARVAQMFQPNDLSYTSWLHLRTFRPRAMTLAHAGCAHAEPLYKPPSQSTVEGRREQA